ncbi:MAG: hypothetical protein AB1641_22260 [Thermodesulfobacteriota bacterium]
MSKVVDFRDYHVKQAVKRCQDFWKTRCPLGLSADTRLDQLSDKTLLTLAFLGKDIMAFLQGLTILALDAGPEPDFGRLAANSKLKILDVNLFLIDQIRWECLKRLGWVRGFPGEEYPLIELILFAEKIKAEFKPTFPQLSETHPNYQEFNWRRDKDGEAMIRAMIPTALAAFGGKVGLTSC